MSDEKSIYPGAGYWGVSDLVTDYAKFIDPTVTATNAMPNVFFDGSSARFDDGFPAGGVPASGAILVGEAYGCDMMLPHGAVVQRIPTDEGDTIVGEQGPELFIPILQFDCAGPGCDQSAPKPQKGWLMVSKVFQVVSYRFCSLRCLANWLALELAKEESR